jgi:6,7-dimethyl-8-ribityllumazine synthase
MEAMADRVETELQEAEREVAKLEEDVGTGVAEPATEVPTFTDEERERLARMEFAVCVGRFYSELAERLVNGATEGFADGGVTPASVHTHGVPGAFELPLAARLLADSGRYAGIACLGAVIRGETDHYDYVCTEAARGIQDVQLATGVPCAFGVLTVEDMDQALARTGGGKRDQGEHAAQAVLALAAMRSGLT